MAAAADNGLIVELVKGRKWEEVGNAKQPLASIALKYVTLQTTLIIATPFSPSLAPSRLSWLIRS